MNKLQIFTTTDRQEEMKKDYRDPVFVGEIRCNSKRVDNICFALEKNPEGRLRIWEYPDFTSNIKNRYIVAFYYEFEFEHCSIIVLDRYINRDKGKDTVVAEWYGAAYHTLIVKVASLLAEFYNNAYFHWETSLGEQYLSRFNTTINNPHPYHAYIEREKEMFDEKKDPIPRALSRGVALYFSQVIMQKPVYSYSENDEKEKVKFLFKQAKETLTELEETIANI